MTSAQHLHVIRDEPVQIEIHWLEDLAPTESEELPSQCRSPFRRFSYLLQVFVAFIIGRRAPSWPNRYSPRCPCKRLLKSCAMPPASCPTASIFLGLTELFFEFSLFFFSQVLIGNVDTKSMDLD